MKKFLINDDCFKKQNVIAASLKSKRYKSKVINGSPVSLRIDHFDTASNNAIVLLDAKDMLQLLQGCSIGTNSGVDNDDSVFPAAGQRTPTSDRTRKISASYENEVIVPDGKMEVLRLFAFGATLKEKDGEIFLVGDFSLSFVDGAGRAASLEKMLEQVGGKFSDCPCVRRNITYQLNIDMSASLFRSLQEFRLYNLFPKKVSKGTNIVVEHALIKEGELVPKNTEDGIFPTFIVGKVYDKPKQGSLLEYLPWNFEGESSESSDFLHSRGNAASLHTAIEYVNKKCDILKMAEWDVMVDFALREWYKMCPNARMSLAFGSGSEAPKKARIVTTLGLKVMIAISAKVFAKVGSDSKKFQDLCQQVISEHFVMFRNSEDGYRNPKSKKMDADKFWFENKWFAGKGFNSGAVNADYIVKQLVQIATQIVDR